jgi:hypothetical protein
VTGTAQAPSKNGSRKTRLKTLLHRIIITRARIERGVQEIINITDWLLRAFPTDTSIVTYHDQRRQTKSSGDFRTFRKLWKYGKTHDLEIPMALTYRKELAVSFGTSPLNVLHDPQVITSNRRALSNPMMGNYARNAQVSGRSALLEQND